MNLKKNIHWERDRPGVDVPKYWVWEVWDEDRDSTIAIGTRRSETEAIAAADEVIARMEKAEVIKRG